MNIKTNNSHEKTYYQIPKMILFDVGGTLFADGKCSPADGFSKLIELSKNSEITNAEALVRRWDELLNEFSQNKSKNGVNLEIPLSAVIKYATMSEGLHFDITMPEQEEIFDRYNSERKVLDGIPELLSVIKKLGIRTAVISNNMMSGESLSLAIRHWLPMADFEFVLTSADILYTKPSNNIFTAALNFANLNPCDCWYCGDGKIPDVDGANGVGMLPVLIDEKSEVPFKIHNDGEYLAINHWDSLKNHLNSL